MNNIFRVAFSTPSPTDGAWRHNHVANVITSTAERALAVLRAKHPEAQFTSVAKIGSHRETVIDQGSEPQ